ncbi:MAG: hypothetical protein D6765_08060, partial [Bacteroidetes bacterium]
PLPVLRPDPQTGELVVRFRLTRPADVDILLLNRRRIAEARRRKPNLPPGQYTERFQTGQLPAGNYLLVVKAGKEILKKYRVVKK